MPNRKVHNLIAKRITGYDYDMIDKVNAKVDSTVKEKGYQHREDYHDRNPMKKDSLEVTHGNVKKEIVRQIHITLDTNPKLNRMGKLLDTYTELIKHGRTRRKS